MKNRDYPAIFSALSAKSRRTIVDDTIKAAVAAGDKPLPREEIAADFEAGGTIAQAYWNAFVRRFDPDDPLERGRWEIGEVGRERAVILITQKGATHPAALQMFLEEGAWKVGLVETFRGGR